MNCSWHTYSRTSSGSSSDFVTWTSRKIRGWLIETEVRDLSVAISEVLTQLKIFLYCTWYNSMIRRSKLARTNWTRILSKPYNNIGVHFVRNSSCAVNKALSSRRHGGELWFAGQPMGLVWSGQDDYVLWSGWSGKVNLSEAFPASLSGALLDHQWVTFLNLPSSLLSRRWGATYLDECFSLFVCLLAYLRNHTPKLGHIDR